MYNLSKRLKTIAGLVPVGSRVADIGADHGYLPIYLIKNNIAQFVLACDIGEKPLENAKKNISNSKTEKIETRLCDGLDGVESDEVDTIIIAGMGGDVISGILSRRQWIKNPDYSLILQPMTSADTLRRFLVNNGFSVNEEVSVLDNKKIYSVMRVKYVGYKTQVKESFYYIGKLSYNTEADKKYIDKQLKILKKCCSDIYSLPEKKDLFNYYNTIIDEIERLL